MRVLPRSFYLDADVVSVARNLIGKELTTHFQGRPTGGIITETEAYAGITDMASHAYNERRTKRTEVMYSIGGTAYVYLCYGVHALFNVVTNQRNIPHAILIRSIEPTIGVDTMQKRRGVNGTEKHLTSGPGNLTKALGITVRHTGMDLTSGNITITEGRGTCCPKIQSATRIGVDYAGKDAAKPWRFLLSGSQWVTHPPSC